MEQSGRKPLELYLHIPFCASKCKYCDFRSAPAGGAARQAYVKDLCRKIRSHGDLAEVSLVVSIFLGGGTPSILKGGKTGQIFQAIRETFSLAEDAEITTEMNPGTVSREKLKAYRNLGINRLSIGLQSMDDRELAMLGRIHTRQDFLETHQMAREEGFSNINVESPSSAIPYQTTESWRDTLIRTAQLGPEHISAYSLIIEEGTPFYEWYGEGRHAEELPDDDTERQMYHDTARILKDYGYHRYEISNYARAGYECRHNLGYWNRTEYLGDRGERRASLIGNRRWVEGEEPQELTVSEQMEEYMFLGLRKMEGVSKEQFRGDLRAYPGERIPGCAGSDVPVGNAGRGGRIRASDRAGDRCEQLGDQPVPALKKGQGIFNLGRGIFENTTSPGARFS